MLQASIFYRILCISSHVDLVVRDKIVLFRITRLAYNTTRTYDSTDCVITNNYCSCGSALYGIQQAALFQGELLNSPYRHI